MNCLTENFPFGSIETPLCFFGKIFLVIKGNRGQLSIFMGITLILVMVMLAFIINIGLFVKAKINLQNSVDAAAFAGAAVQARQLTNIAYANWELRNTYKEWMFKYYVLGQLGQMPYNLKESCISGKGTVDYRLPTPPISGFGAFDKYNIPSICIHNNSKTNICPMFALPGIPRFPAVGVAGIAEIHEAFVTKLVEEKGKDCSRRSKANYLAALNWAYGAGNQPVDPEAPLVVTNRPGAWPEALELAMRIRNLEMIVNRPAVANLELSKMQELQSAAGSEIGLNERPLKAFWSAFRNLGGGLYKDCIEGSSSKINCSGANVDELALKLKLTEIAPQSFNAKTGGADTVSSFLIPDMPHPAGGGGKVTDKQYLDLQLMPVNLATMFSTFVDTANNNVSLGGVQSEATCGISKTALPVPGYILGFNKNPKVLTYYAVKGESKFIGLFFPVNGSASEGITLTAYAAAKPFGGRIGPKLFNFENGRTVKARADVNTRSSSMVSGMEISNLSTSFQPGMPIPPGRDFWINMMNTAVGGVPGAGTDVYFGIPNMIYDFEDENDLLTQRSSTGTTVQVINPSGSPISFPGNPESSCPSGNSGATLGLYHAPQLKALKKSLGNPNPGTTMSGEDVLRAIVRSRRATKYDAINYLVPDFRELTDHNNALPMVQVIDPVLNVGFRYRLFAPLLGPNTLYKTTDAVKTIVNQYMELNKDAIKTFLRALLEVGNSIAATPAANPASFIEAAKSIHYNSGLPAGTSEIPPAYPGGATETDPNCHLDMASKFYHFFNAEYNACGVIPLKKMMIDYVNAHSANEGGVDRSLYYIGYYYSEPTNPARLELDPDKLMTAYYPAPRYGVTPDNKAIVEHPLKLSLDPKDSYSTKRNFYSTKFFQMAKVIDGPPMKNNSTEGRRDYQKEPALRESLIKAPDDLVGENAEIENPLKMDATTGINDPFYLDF